MYPVTFDAAIPLEGRNRLTTFFRYFTAIPIQIVALVYGIGAFFGVIGAWFAILFTGRYPQGIYDFIGKALRISSRANAYYYLAVDQYPPFNGDDDPSYPVRIGIPEPLGAYNRVKTLFRIIIGIPVMLLVMVWSIILSVVALIAWFAILFTGKLPEGLARPLHGGLAYSTKAGAYFLLMTEDYPPFSDDGDVVPAGRLVASESKAPLG